MAASTSPNPELQRQHRRFTRDLEQIDAQIAQLQKERAVKADALEQLKAHAPAPSAEAPAPASDKKPK